MKTNTKDEHQLKFSRDGHGKFKCCKSKSAFFVLFHMLLLENADIHLILFQFVVVLFGSTSAEDCMCHHRDHHGDEHGSL